MGAVMRAHSPAAAPRGGRRVGHDGSVTAGLLLDLDRTLVDLQSWTDYAAALAEVGDIIDVGALVGLPDVDWDAPTLACMTILVGLAGDPRWDAASTLIAAHERAAIVASTPMPTVAEALEECAGTPTGVVTLLPADVAVEVLAHHGIGVGSGAHIDIVVGREPTLRPKPSGDGLRRAAGILGVDVGATVMIGDSAWDRAAAADCGAAFIGVPRGPDVFDDVIDQAPDLHSAVRAALAPR